MIEKQFPYPIIRNTKCLSYPPSLLCNSNNQPFLNSWISAIHDKVDGLSAKMVKSLKRDCFFIVEPLLSVQCNAIEVKI